MSFFIFGSMMRTAYESGRESGETEALQKYYFQTGVCMPKISEVIRECDAMLKNASQNYHAPQAGDGSAN